MAEVEGDDVSSSATQSTGHGSTPRERQPGGGAASEAPGNYSDEDSSSGSDDEASGDVEVASPAREVGRKAGQGPQGSPSRTWSDLLA